MKVYDHAERVYKSFGYLRQAGLMEFLFSQSEVVFARYMMLSLESRKSNDERSLGELFLYFSDEMSATTWIKAFQLLLQMLRKLLTDNLDIADDKIEILVDAFMNTFPSVKIKTTRNTNHGIVATK